MDLSEVICDCVNWIEVAENCVQWQALFLVVLREKS